MYSQQLKTFIQVADRGSLSKAAEDLFVTPASVMKQMNVLENRLQLKLISRTNQGIELTATGKYLYGAAKEMIAESEIVISKAKEIQYQSMKTIRVGSSFLNPSQVLTDLWNSLCPGSAEFRIKIVPYQDDHGQILSVVSSLGKKFDFLVGVFGSQQMLSLSNFYELGRYALCVAVPRSHRLASKAKLTFQDLYGERIIIVKSGDSPALDRLRARLNMTHPQIIFEETNYFYDLETFNACEATGSLLLTLDAWANIHPSLITLPVDWELTVPYGLLYSKTPSETAVAFLDAIKCAHSA